jgi:hypothetical protein
MYFVSICENRRMQLVEIVLRRGEAERGITLEMVNPPKTHHNSSPHNNYMLIKSLKN